MLYKTLSAAVYGIDASIIEVEGDVSGIKTNEDYFHTVGLPEAAVRESRDRVRAALKNCGYDIPPTHITINLARADIRKEGSGFDLPMALGILGAYGGLIQSDLPDCLFPIASSSVNFAGRRGPRRPRRVTYRDRRKPWVGGAKRPGSPEGAKETNATHRHEPPRTFHLQHETTLRSHQARIREGSTRLPRRHRPSNWRYFSLRQWHSRSRASSRTRARDPFRRRYRSSDKNEFVEVGARALA